jgi:hypothetical protein
VTKALGADEVRIAFMYDAVTLGRAMTVLAHAVAAYPARRQLVAASR